MAISIKNEEEIALLRKSGKILAQTLDLVCQNARPGISTKELDHIAEEYIISKGASPSFKGYQGFPATLCTCLNEKVVHSIPQENETLKEGDLFTVDCGVTLNGLITDAARSIAIGKVSPQKNKLIETAKRALSSAIDVAIPGNKVSHISRVIQNVIESAGFKVIYDLTGHGVGRKLHEDPIILNYYDGNPSPTLKPGMVLAIEPIFAVSTSQIVTLKDGWTITTKDNSCAVQAENTILITQKTAEILTEI
ncbi:type I methionyl aminopeptidase [Patescibacteria group bacterium]|nr:type I methionyl aminopeptidase [Patescibacteria group bacterium]